MHTFNDHGMSQTQQARQAIQERAGSSGNIIDSPRLERIFRNQEMDQIRVHYNAAGPAQIQAHAYAQGSDIHVAPGQERHLPHEAWHVVQQALGRP